MAEIGSPNYTRRTNTVTPEIALKPLINLIALRISTEDSFLLVVFWENSFNHMGRQKIDGYSTLQCLP